MRPVLGRTPPVRILTKVLLPAPLAPISAWTSPGRTESDADFNATTEPYVFETPLASSKSSVAVTVMSYKERKPSGRYRDLPLGCYGTYLVEPIRPDPCNQQAEGPARGCSRSSPG